MFKKKVKVGCAAELNDVLEGEEIALASFGTHKRN
jgi:hypothetical protein